MNIFLLLLLFNFSEPITKTYEGKVIKVTDGDTFELLLDDKTTIKIRLNGIDAPEKKQDYFLKSKQYLSALIFGKRIKVIEYSKDKYKRAIADIYYNTDWINLNMLKNGMAWHFKKYSKNIQLSNAENTAKKSKIGLWSQSYPIAPWIFRKNKKSIFPQN